MQRVTSQNRYSALAIAIAFGALLLVTAALSWPALSGPFLFDDFPNLKHLAALHGRLDWRSLAHYVSLFEGQPGRPLSMLSFVINDAAWPSDPRPFKYTNLLLHLLVGTLLFGLARSLARNRTSQVNADLAALVATAAWLLNPMQLSTSMLVVQRMTQLSALFAVGGLWAYVALASRARNASTAIAAVASLGVATVLSLLCKETGALVPVLAMVINTTLLRPRLAETEARPKRILLYGTGLPVVALLCAITFRWDALTWYGTRDFTLFERLASQGRALCEYLFRIVIPSLRGGGIYHDDFAISRNLLTPWTTAPALLAVAVLFLTAIAMRRRWRVFSFAILWFLGGHALESTVFPLELYFEHRNYLPMFGILFGLALWVFDASGRWRKMAVLLAVLYVGYAAFLTTLQARIWGDSTALATVWAIEHPNSARAVQQHADVVARAGNPGRAADILRSAYLRGVRGTDFPMQVMALACVEGNARMAERTGPLLSGLSSDPYNSATLATTRALRQLVEVDTCPGLMDGREWLQLTNDLLDNPNFGAGEARAYLHVERAYFFRRRGNLELTMHEFEAAWVVHPEPSLARLMAATLASAGLYQEAIQWAEKALGTGPHGLRGLLSQEDAETHRLIEVLGRLKEKESDRKTEPEADH